MAQLKKEHAEVVKLVNITRPANLPPLIPQTKPEQSTSSSSKTVTTQKALPMFGKRLKIKVMLPSRELPSTVTSTHESEEEEEFEEKEIVLETEKSGNLKTNENQTEQSSSRLSEVVKEPTNSGNLSSQETNEEGVDRLRSEEAPTGCTNIQQTNEQTQNTEVSILFSLQNI